MPVQLANAGRGTVNEEGKLVELYAPRKCSATNQLIHATDHAAVQINVGDVNTDGVYTRTYKTFAFCGDIRNRGRSDIELNRLAIDAKIIKPLK